MLKPTSRIISSILSLVLSHNEILGSLHQRDANPDVRIDQISCRFYRNDPGNHLLSFYIVECRYVTRYDKDEQYDDVAILVQVIEATTPQLSIKEVKFF